MSLITTPFLTEPEFKEYTNVSLTMDARWYIHNIELAQISYIECELGKELSDELKDQIDNNTLTQENIDLLLKIKPALSYYTYYIALPDIQFRSHDLGVRINTEPYSEPASGSQLKYFGDSILNKAERFKTVLLKFLEDNKEDYPLWKGNCNKKCDYGKAPSLKYSGTGFRKNKFYPHGK